MKLILYLLIFMLFMVVPPAFLGAGWYFRKANKHGRFRKEYERGIFRFCVVVLTLILGGLFVYGFIDTLSHSSPHRGGLRNTVEIGFAAVIFGGLYLAAILFSHCAVVGVRKTFPSGSRLLVSLGVLLGGALGPLRLGLLSLMGFNGPTGSESLPNPESAPTSASKVGMVARFFTSRPRR